MSAEDGLHEQAVITMHGTEDEVRDRVTRLQGGIQAAWEAEPGKIPGTTDVRLTGSPVELRKLVLRYTAGNLEEAMHILGDDSWSPAIALCLHDQRTEEMAAQAQDRANMAFASKILEIDGRRDGGDLSDEQFLGEVLRAAEERKRTVTEAFDRWVQYGPE